MLFLVLGFVSLSSSILFGQEASPSPCAVQLLDETDSVQGTYTRRFKEKLVVQNSAEDLLEFDLKQFNDVLVFSVLVKGAGDCLDENSKMTIRFVSGATISLGMDGKFNCDNEFAAFFGGTFGKKKEFRACLTNEIETVKVETRKSVIDKTRKNFVEVKFTPEQRIEFVMRLGCLLE